MGSVPRTMLGTASASVATARNVGNAAGLAMASAVFAAWPHSSAGLSGLDVEDLPTAALLDGIRAAFLAAGLVSMLAIAASALREKRPEPRVIHEPALTPRTPSPDSAGEGELEPQSGRFPSTSAQPRLTIVRYLGRGHPKVAAYPVRESEMPEPVFCSPRKRRWGNIRRRSPSAN